MQITETVHALKHTFFIPVNPDVNLERFVYSFVLFGKKFVYLIDSGVAESESAILEYIRQNNRSVDDIKTLILTHSHPDHIGSAKSIKEQTGCKIMAHAAEKDWIQDVDRQFRERPVPGFHSLVQESVDIDQFLQDDDRIELEDGLKVQVMHTPGHSGGSMSLLLNEGSVLISADAVLLPGSLPIYDDAVETVRSVTKLRNLKGIQWLLASWDDPVEEEEIPGKLDESVNYLKTIHRHILEVDDPGNLSPMDLCKKVVDKMGLPPAAVNPLVAQSFQSHVKNPDAPELV